MIGLMEPKKGLKDFEINMNIQEIQIMKSTKFKHIVKMQASKSAFKYLLEKQALEKKRKAISLWKNLGGRLPSARMFHISERIFFICFHIGAKLMIYQIILEKQIFVSFLAIILWTMNI